MIFSQINSREKQKLRFVFFVSVCSAVFDVLGVASIMPFVALLTDERFEAKLVDLADSYFPFILESDISLIFLVGIASFMMLLFGLFFRAYSFHSQLRFALNVERHLGCRLMDRYLHRSFLWHASQNSSHLVKNILSEVGTVVNSGLMPMLTICTCGLSAGLIVVLLFSIDSLITLSTILVFLVFYWLCHFIFKKPLRELSEIQVKYNQERFFVLKESFEGVREILFLGNQDFFTTNYKQFAKQFASSQLAINLIAQMPRYVFEAIAFGGLMLVTIVLIHRHGGVAGSIPTIALFALAGYRLMPAIQTIYIGISQIEGASASIRLICSEMDNAQNEQSNAGQQKYLVQSPKIRLHNISFTFEGRVHPALKDISFQIGPGEFVVIVGDSGSGKSTLLNVLLGLIPPDKGDFFVNGNRQIGGLRDYKNVAYVPQTVFLSDSTIAANIAFGIAPDDIDFKKVLAVAEVAQVNEFALSQPEGFATVVGESASRLSGGQKQRLGIARALYRNPAVLILDEATSALDGDTEAKIIEGLMNLGGDMIVIAVTHRLETTKKATRVIEMRSGSIVEKSTEK